jgi:hypothetical protein
MVFPFIVSTIKREATAIHHFILIVIYFVVLCVMFESDCQIVVNTVTNDRINLNEL